MWRNPDAEESAPLVHHPNNVIDYEGASNVIEVPALEDDTHKMNNVVAYTAA